MTTATDPVLKRKSIGASRAAAVCGVSPWSNPFLEYLFFTGQTDDKEPNEAMLLGIDLEDGIRRVAERHLDQHIHKPPGRVQRQQMPGRESDEPRERELDEAAGCTETKRSD